VLKKLIEEGKTIFVQDSFHGRNALHWAAIEGHAECVKLLLLANEKSIHDKVDDDDGRRTLSIHDTRYGYTPLHYAARSGHTECVKLLSNEVSINDKDDNGFTALHFAAMIGHPECVKVLLNEKSCNIDAIAKNFNRSTPLIRMLNNDHDDKDKKNIVKILCEHGANTKLSDTYRKTAVHYAIEGGSGPEVVKWLVQGTGNPPTLRQLARTKIRIQLSNCDKFCRENIWKLPMPETLKEYLLLTDLEDGLEEKKLMKKVSEILF